jgi:diguanylate cyclase (GGDEF)-like protein
MDVSERQFVTDTIDGRYFKMHRMTLASGIHVVFGMEITELELVKKSLEESILALKIQATTDELTQINNRRAFMTSAEAEFTRAKRYFSKLTFIMIDIDRFKLVNDKYGHPVGDCVIQHVASLLRETIRECDSVGRLGGEEFTILLPNTDLTGANVIAERLRIRIAESSITTDTVTDLSVTCSLGVSEFSVSDEKLDNMIVRADNALYKAKEGGRNRVCLSAR